MRIAAWIYLLSMVRLGRDVDKCMWCDKPATRYCDAPIGFEAVDAMRDKAGNVIGLLAGGGKSWTCDAPMCDEHGQQVGHICGQEPDSIDKCPHHLEHPEKPLRNLVMFEREAEGSRREVYANIRRAVIKANHHNAE